MLLPPCLLITAVQQPGTSSPPSRLKHSSECVIWMCYLQSPSGLPDVDLATGDTIYHIGLLTKRYLGKQSNVVYRIPYGPALWSPPSGSDGDTPMHAPLQLTSPSSPSRRHLGVPSVLSPVSVWSPRCRPGRSGRGQELLVKEALHIQMTPSEEMEDWKSLVAGPL